MASQINNPFGEALSMVTRSITQGADSRYPKNPHRGPLAGHGVHSSGRGMYGWSRLYDPVDCQNYGEHATFGIATCSCGSLVCISPVCRKHHDDAIDHFIHLSVPRLKKRIQVMMTPAESAVHEDNADINEYGSNNDRAIIIDAADAIDTINATEDLSAGLPTPQHVGGCQARPDNSLPLSDQMNLDIRRVNGKQARPEPIVFGNANDASLGRWMLPGASKYPEPLNDDGGLGPRPLYDVIEPPAKRFKIDHVVGATPRAPRKTFYTQPRIRMGTVAICRQIDFSIDVEDANGEP
jgi:hypothetical protein